MAQQMATEWLAVKLFNAAPYPSVWDKYIEQAKEMEKQQMMSFANWCRIHDSTHENEIWTIQQLFDKYNNETFKK